MRPRFFGGSASAGSSSAGSSGTLAGRPRFFGVVDGSAAAAIARQYFVRDYGHRNEYVPLVFGAVFFVAGTGASAATVPRRGRPAAAVVSISVPRFVVTVAGGSAGAAAALALRGVVVALLFFGGIVL